MTEIEIKAMPLLEYLYFKYGLVAHEWLEVRSHLIDPLGPRKYARARRSTNALT